MTRPRIHARRAAVLARLHGKAEALAGEIATDLLALYPPDDLAAGQVRHLADVTVASLLNCLHVEHTVQHGLATLRRPEDR